MKLRYSVLEKLIELPTKNLKELRHALDDLGLEVKGLETEGPDTIFNIETLANRGDHLCALGVAREISARYMTPVKHPALAREFEDRKPSLEVKILTDLCPRYAILEMTLPSSMKLSPEIAAALGGVDSDRHPIVHILNYVQLELGQPMHAFDREKLEGKLLIDVTAKLEEIEALDGKRYKLPVGTIVIKDSKKIVAAAGIIGCSNSMVSSSTTRVALESACFDPVSVRKSARAMGLSTDASYTFERGSDIEMVTSALRRVVVLSEGSAGVVSNGAAVHVLGYSCVDSKPFEKSRISFSLAHLRKQLNLVKLPEIEVTTRFRNLGFQIESSGEGANTTYSVVVPSWRSWDIKNRDDLVEEFARAYGLSRVKPDLPPLDYEPQSPEPIELLTLKFEAALLGQGFYEVMTKSFVTGDDVRLLEQLDPGAESRHVKIKNSVEKSYSNVKLTNILHLSRLSQQNHAKGVGSFKVYELGRLFSLANGEKRTFEFERDTLTLACSGRWFEHDFRKPENLEELLVLFKGALEGIFQALGHDLYIVEATHPFLHPGMQGSLRVGKKECGVFGAIHPKIKQTLDLRLDTLYAEIDLGVLVSVVDTIQFSPPSEFPAIKRDITLQLKPRSLAGSIVKIVKGMDLPHLLEIAVADDFKRDNEDFRRTTFRLTFQSPQGTLEHEAIDTVMNDLVNTLSGKHQITLAP